MGTPADVQNNYINLFGLGFNKTRILHRGNDEKNYLSINPQIQKPYTNFYDRLLRIFPIFSVLLQTK